MAKKGVYKISGSEKPKIGEKTFYTVDEWYPKTPQADRDPSKVIWELFVKGDNGFESTDIKKKGINHFTFGKNAYKYTYKVEGYLHEPEGQSPMSIIVNPQQNKQPADNKEKNILGVTLTYEDASKITKPLSYKDRLKATASCEGMEGEKVVFSLWEDDAEKSGHNKNNQHIAKSPPREVNKYGKAIWIFPLSSTFISLVNRKEDDKKHHEYYVTAEYYGKLEASDNVNADNPEYITPAPTPQKKPTLSPSPNPKQKPKIQPKKDTPKASVKPSSPNNQADKKGNISSVKLTDSKGKAFSKMPRFGETIQVIIEGNNLVGKKYILRLWEHDLIGDNDLLYNQVHTFKANKQIVYTPLSKEMEKTGKIGNNAKNPDSGEYTTEWNDHQEIFAEVVFLSVSSKSSTIDVGITETAKPPEQKKSPVKIDKVPKEKFAKVDGNGKEAVLYVSSEIVTEIKVDKNDKMISYPDTGGYNGQSVFKEGNKIYAKKISDTKSAYPLFKAYIYRGSKIGEAVKKLKQDLEHKTHENAESTVLTVARHAETNNKNYGKSGPIPPNTLKTLYRIRYKQATNLSGKVSFRYRIVDDNATNMTTVKDISKEVFTGGMNLGSRSSISIDPWKSKDLIGCLGIRNADGTNHPSCAGEMGDLSAANYKFVYHALNNYMEIVIPELKGVYGRRGYSSNGKIAVAASDFTEEVKVFILIDPLPELNSCECNLEDRRKKYYGSFGEKTVKYIDDHSQANKFKGLYMVAQRRQENGFSIKTPLNNPMNIKGSGDEGKEKLSTHETYNGKYQAVVDSFAKFTSEDAGFQGYLNLLKKNYPHAYSALTTDAMTIEDFVVGLEDKGLKGAYATGEAKGGMSGTEQYKTAVKNNFKSVQKDYKKWLVCKLCSAKTLEEKNKIKEDLKLLSQLK